LAISTVLIWQVKNETVQMLEREQLSSYWQRIALADRKPARVFLGASPGRPR
jgi:hypothetical protein